MIIGLRRGAVNTGAWEDSYGTKLFLTMERNGNSLGLPSNERQKFIEKNALPIYDGTQEYCLWLGCMGAYDPAGRETILALVKVLEHLEITFGVLKKEKCNGDPARRLGNDLLFTTLAEENIETHRSRSKAVKLLSICPHCVRTMSVDWREAGRNRPDRASLGIARPPQGAPARRHGAAREKSRSITIRVTSGAIAAFTMSRGTCSASRWIVVEAPRNRERSFCCGAGGGQMFLGEEKGKRINIARAEELIATGAETVAAACPFCASMFRDALKTVSDTPPKLLDIVQIVARNIAD